MRKKTAMLLAALVLSLAVGSAALAAPGGPLSSFTIPWWTVDGGGGASSGGVYSLRGTIGQAEPGVHTGSSYTLIGGFWGGAVAQDYALHLPTVLRTP
jgi:hypothetical protein